MSVRKVPAGEAASFNNAAHNRATLGDEKSPVPLYHRIYVLMRERIFNGTYRAGQLLPSEAELMERFGVSRITARRALDELSYEGLVDRERGRGTRVSQRPLVELGDAPIIAGMEGLMANLERIGKRSEVIVFEFDFVPAPDPVAVQMQIAPGALVQRAVRSRSVEGKPFSLSTTYVLEEIGRTFDREDLTSIPIIDLITRAGRTIDHVDQSLTATLADDIMAQRLGMHVASPLLKVRRTFYDTTNTPCYYVDLYYRPDRFEYRMTLTRGNDNRFRVNDS
ncbi:GntR family transcriptional regulator [Limoniibacter endophyticus]|uniref:GntR family transcriptional regulator n=1 Tax=Limoniibacter endophyticus TaxID=1565040 RepID=A0A8J3DH67_9HYPH|nr:GntR family transcriptional regulator [Limoniibacter endophyticus]GHC66270.1 GntR family transcriptional regulator [Limoniibacter endophyticus]